MITLQVMSKHVYADYSSVTLLHVTDSNVLNLHKQNTVKQHVAISICRVAQ